jgi:hypothetical protein
MTSAVQQESKSRIEELRTDKTCPLQDCSDCMNVGEARAVTGGRMSRSMEKLGWLLMRV